MKKAFCVSIIFIFGFVKAMAVLSAFFAITLGYAAFVAWAAASLSMIAQAFIFVSGVLAIFYAAFEAYWEYRENWRVRNP